MALRIPQLEARKRDEKILDYFLSDLLRLAVNFPIFDSREDEMKLALKTFLWYFSIWKRGQTFGQKTLNMSYRKAGNPILSHQRVVYLLIDVILPYLTEKWAFQRFTKYV
ncbi:unnamed protein product [Soboliphyme baturini]|uniref:Pex2_Pex12 domain-containing protein n=1 Tax=Soboliphyme baturini TaxID=241478 RepID=A0A183J1V2_9BILA|nr:unnamed protein product [Soboliphyme baturini]